nr:putative nucleotidyltransferase, ribonuclease H [Tanacetum cinerariifolium]
MPVRRAGVGHRQLGLKPRASNFYLSDEDIINGLVEEYMEHLEHEKSKEDLKTHTVGGVWLGEYMHHGFTKSMKELDRCYDILQKLRSVIVDGALIHKNHEGSKHEGRRIRPNIVQATNPRSTMEELNNGKRKRMRIEILVGRNVNPCGYGVRQSYRVKTEIPNFFGNLNIEAVLDWLYEVDKFFDIMKVPKEKQVKVVTYKLHGRAGAWWQREQDDRRAQEEDELDYAEPLDEEAEQVTYVVQQTLCSLKVSDSSKRNKIFQTKCLVKENIYSIIIHGRSCGNLVSKALVKAFKLPTERHFNPYQIGWIQKWPTLKVTEICIVPLAIEKHYNELVTCDVVGIEACHVLLGRPWQHDVDTTHQRKSNMYLFKWSEKTIAMLPLGVVSPKKKLENKTLVSLVASPKEFQAKRKVTRVSYALIVKYVKDVMENAISSVVKPLLAEFSKIVTDDTSDALPPLRNIQHQVDLIPRASLPNLPHYRMILRESKVLHEKIEELLKKGHIQESISPCVVPALLTPNKDAVGRCALIVEPLKN